jgi:thiosulfate dehydrogenase [quinone] large subunit
MTDVDIDIRDHAPFAPAPVHEDRRRSAAIPRGAVNVASLLRISIGLLYLWGFASQAFGIGFTNKAGTAGGWFFSLDGSKGWITSGFTHSASDAFVSSAHGPLAFVPQHLPTGVDDFLWLFALGGLGIALTLGICMRIAGWGGFALNMLLWLSTMPTATNPLIDGEHTILALSVLLLMYLRAGDHWGLGRSWSRRTPAALH